MKAKNRSWHLKAIAKDEFGLFKYEPGEALKFGTVILPNLDAGSEFQKANFRLIANAPTLLVAVKKSLDDLKTARDLMLSLKCPAVAEEFEGKMRTLQSIIASVENE